MTSQAAALPTHDEACDRLLAWATLAGCDCTTAGACSRSRCSYGWADSSLEFSITCCDVSGLRQLQLRMLRVRNKDPSARSRITRLG